MADDLAVECTSLVKLTQSGSDVIRASQLHPRTIESLRNAIQSVSVDDFETSYFVGLEIKEPVDIRNARRALRQVLLDHSTGQAFPHLINVCDGLKINIQQTHSKKPTKYRLGSISGPDFSGWVGSDLIQQCQDAVGRKLDAIKRLRRSYREVWLAVGSNITTGDMHEYLPSLSEHLAVPPELTKLVLINPIRPETSVRLSFHS